MATEMKRIIAHWTGGANRASSLDREHYHKIVEIDGTVVTGNETIADNIVTSDGDYAAHTLHLNTGSIGVAVCGMAGAVESPLSCGDHPITETQFDAFCETIARLCLEYDIEVTPQTVLTHAEVETNLGVKQRGKWDITVLPWRSDLRGARVCGDYMREKVKLKLGARPQRQADPRPILRTGDQGIAVAELQHDLEQLRYFVGRVDGIFGPRTRDMVMAFQADHGLSTTGVVDHATRQALDHAAPRPERDVSQEEIDQKSGTCQDARVTEAVGGVVGVGGPAVIATQIDDVSASIDTASNTMTGLSGALSRASELVTANWPALLLIGGCVAVWFILRANARQTRARRLRDAREGRNLAR